MKTYFKYLFPIILLGFIFPTGILRGHSNPQALLDSATSSYTKGFYSDAVVYYEKVLSMGFESAEVYYNLGNAYFKLNELAPAIYNYEKALMLKPGDEDILFNLKIANSRITDKIDVVPEFFFQRWWESFYNFFPTDTWAILSLVFLGLFLLALGIFLLSKRISYRKIGLWSAVVLIVFASFSFAFAWKGQQRQSEKRNGIIFEPAVVVKSSPDNASVDLFVLHEGTKVEIQDKLDNWVKIKIVNGNIGWFPVFMLREY